jgi:zinc protease
MFSARCGALAALAVLLLGSACALTRLEPPPRRGVTSPTRLVLPNGVTIIVHEHRSSEVVAIQLWVKVGARDEAPAELGLAHYLEHMVFKGTPSRPPGFIDRDVERAGGRVNGSTSLDYTNYRMIVPAQRATSGIDMLVDIGVNATLDATLLDAEKRVVLEEMRRDQDDPERSLILRLYAALFAGHPYGRPVIGRAEQIRDLSRDTLLAFYRRHYVPEAFALVVVGAVNHEEIMSAATKAVGRLPRGGWVRLPPPPARGLRPSREDVVRPGLQAHLGLGWLGPKVDHADTAAMDLVVSILGQTRSSRLTEAVRERLGLARSIRSAYSALEAGGIVSVTAVLDPDDLDRAERAIVNEIRRLRDVGVTDVERRRAATIAEARHEFVTETAEGRADLLGQAETVWRMEEELAYVDRLRAVTAEQMRAAARHYLDPDHYVRAALVPPSRR